MSKFSSNSIGLVDLVGAGFSTPLLSLGIALIVVVAIITLTGAGRADRAAVQRSFKTRRGAGPDYSTEHRTLGLTAIAVIVGFVVEGMIRGYLINFSDVVSWWRFSLPLVCGSLGLAVLLSFIVTRGTSRPEVPVVSGARRTWVSSGPRARIIAACTAMVVLTATTIWAGLTSSPDDRGRYIWLVIPVPNEAAIDPIRHWFYGWAYGVPVLIALVVLATVTWAVLHCNAARPYLRPESLVGERGSRRAIAAGVVHVASASVLIALAGAWRFIAQAGSGSQLVITGENAGEPYDVAWRFAELAVVVGWLAPLLEITAFVLLSMVAAQLVRRPDRDRSGESAELPSQETPVL